MRIISVLLVMLSIMCSSTEKKAKDNEITISGLAQESKAGLLVDGVVLMPLSYDKIEYYNAKYLEVKGYLMKENSWKNEETDPGKPQKTTFNMPIMEKITSIKIIEK